jgi:hypothetical protein
MNRKPAVLSGFLLISLLTSTALAWNPTGHMAIASVAYDRLSADRRAALVGILKSHPRFSQDFRDAMPKDVPADQQDRWILMRAAIWPDVARAFTGEDLAKYHRPIWHYLDIPVYLDDKAKEAIHPQYDLDYHKAKVEATMNAVQALNKNLDVLNDPAAPAPQKAVALCWVLHLAGDLHQPLHGAALFSTQRFYQLPAGDRGGNEIHVHEKEGLLASFKTPNLHALWDCALGIDETWSSIMSVASSLQSESSKLDSARSSLDPGAWAQESNAVAKQVVYTPDVLALVRAGEATPKSPLPVFEITDDYLKTARATAKERGAAAAIRSAAILEPK